MASTVLSSEKSKFPKIILFLFRLYDPNMFDLSKVP